MNKDEKGRLFNFFSKESKKLNNYVRRKIQSIGYMDAEDIVADVMLKLFKSKNRGVNVENLAGYVYRSLYNKIIDYQRTSNRTISLQSNLDENGENLLMEFLIDNTANTSNELERKELIKNLSQAISSLDTKQRAVFIATELQGKSYKELSLEWKEPIGTLLSRKSRAIKALQISLKEYRENNREGN